MAHKLAGAPNEGQIPLAAPQRCHADQVLSTFLDQDFKGAFLTRSDILTGLSEVGLARAMSIAVTFFFTICTTSSSIRM